MRRCEGRRCEGAGGAVARKRGLLDGHNLDLPFASQHSHTHVVRMALEADVDACVADGEVGQADPVERFRKPPA